MVEKVMQFKKYYGRVVDKMPLMLTHGVAPLSVMEFMRHREEIVRYFGDVYTGTSDLVAYGGERISDEIKMILTVDNKGRITEDGRKALWLINPLQERSPENDKIVLSGEIYRGFSGRGVVSLSRKELGKYGGIYSEENMLEDQVLKHPGWRVLLRHPDAVPAEFAYDEGLIKEVVGRTFSKLKIQSRIDNLGMNFHIRQPEEEFPKMLMWHIDFLKYRSGAFSGIGLTDGVGRLIGIVPEVVNYKGNEDQTSKDLELLEAERYDLDKSKIEGLEGLV